MAAAVAPQLHNPETRGKAASNRSITEKRVPGRILCVSIPSFRETGRCFPHKGKCGGGAEQSHLGANTKDVVRCFRCAGAAKEGCRF